MVLFKPLIPVIPPSSLSFSLLFPRSSKLSDPSPLTPDDREEEEGEGEGGKDEIIEVVDGKLFAENLCVEEREEGGVLELFRSF